MTASVYSQNYNGTYECNDTGFVLKVSNYHKTNGSLTFELIVNEHPCFGTRKEIAQCCEYDEKENEFVFQTDQDDNPVFLYLTFNVNGTVSVKSDENGFDIVGMCGIWNDNVIFKKINTSKKPLKKKK